MGEWWDKIRKRFNDWNQEREEEIKRAWDVLDRRGTVVFEEGENDVRNSPISFYAVYFNYSQISCV